jgi:hypothetical protein
MTVLLQGPGQHGEMHLPVFFIDRHRMHDRLSLAVPGDQHHAGTDAGRIAGLARRGPAESLVVGGVEVGCQVDLLPTLSNENMDRAQLPPPDTEAVSRVTFRKFLYPWHERGPRMLAWSR